jgi:hypothetical protein
LEECVQKHSHFSALCKTFQDWLSAEQDSLDDCDDVSGEKTDISKWITSVKVIQACLK